MRRSLPTAVAAAVLTVTLTSVSPAAAHGVPDGASVRAWNAVAVDTIVAAVPPVPGPVGPLYLTYVHRAVYDAVGDAVHDDDASVPAAVAAAASTVLVHHFPAQAQALRDRYTAALAEVPDGAAEARGIALGEAAAAALLREREDDGLNGPPPPLTASGPGAWAPADPNVPAVATWLARVRPFVLDSPSALRPAGPPALTSDLYARDYEEVRVLGGASSTQRTPEQTAVALFWADPPAVQSQRALRGYSEQEGLDALATARLFALVDTASTDALIACFDAKVRYDFWRPIGAVPAGDTDGNPRTPAEPGWTSLVPTPNFPEYPSNHACATTALVTVIDGLDGRGPFSLTMTSVRGTPPAVADTHTWRSPEQVVSEVVDARVWGGLHFRFSTVDGADIGRAVGRAVLESDR
ncbi:vanadium-dependent haloperoxidase [Geodermatophilus sp. SYSU D01045]